MYLVSYSMVTQSGIPLHEFRSTRRADKKSIFNIPHDESGFFTLDQVRSRRIALSPAKAFLVCAALVLSTAAATAGDAAQGLLAGPAWSGHARSFGSAGQAEPQPTDVVERQGPFLIDDQQFTVVLHEKVLRENSGTAASEGTPVMMLAGLEIFDATSHAVYQETFPVVLADGRFSQTLTASASLLAAKAGTAIVIRFIGQPVFGSGALGAPAKESWQVFGLVDGQLTILGAVLPLGQGADRDQISGEDTYLVSTPAAPPSDGAEPNHPITLLQLKNGWMYGLTDYWVEGDNLHYVTNYGGKNSVPLDLIDFGATIRLNSERGVELSLHTKRQSAAQ